MSIWRGSLLVTCTKRPRILRDQASMKPYILIPHFWSLSCPSADHIWFGPGHLKLRQTRTALWRRETPSGSICRNSCERQSLFVCKKVSMHHVEDMTHWRADLWMWTLCSLSKMCLIERIPASSAFYWLDLGNELTNLFFCVLSFGDIINLAC